MAAGKIRQTMTTLVEGRTRLSPLRTLDWQVRKKAGPAEGLMRDWVVLERVAQLGPPQGQYLAQS